MKDLKRALRRHHIERLKHTRRFYSWRDLQAEVPGVLQGYVHTSCRCSCWMCGNPRKYFHEVTRQEKKLLAYAASFIAVCQDAE